MICSFAPIINTSCRVLILGSMPSIQSLNQNEYYANKQNHFWRIVYGLFDLTPAISYEIKKSFLLDKGIALWDVLACCEREGSSDANIKNAVANDIPRLLRAYLGINAVYFNGIRAKEEFDKQLRSVVPDRGIHFTLVPSTSSARVMKFEEKLSAWRVILDELTSND